ncbi:Biotin synthase [Sporomusa carbonis]|uniref:radical SAM protein n=1 Tax=Sporomusa carbonis TaxID=3076075 RepID=UPI003A6A18EE
MSLWKLSAGTACVVGKKQLKTDVLPTTAYIMLGEKCRNHCRFCSQSRDSSARADLLSRVTWPEVPGEEAAQAVGAAFRAGRLQRACLQVVHNEQSWQTSVDALERLVRESAVPVCISSAIDSVAQAKELIARGADRICISLDAATPEIFRQVKGGRWQERWNLLTRCAAELPGRVSTHLIVGLGETEQEIIETIAHCLDNGISVGLFAFTPVRGTVWADRQPPAIGRYRRVQIAHFLLKTGYSRAVFRFQNGILTGISLPVSEMKLILAGGTAFETSGCSGCNRPYYNERPGGVMYNYPRALTGNEIQAAIAESGIIGIHAEQERRRAGCEMAGHQ